MNDLQSGEDRAFAVRTMQNREHCDNLIAQPGSYRKTEFAGTQSCLFFQILIKTDISYTKKPLVAALMHEASFDVILIGYGPVSQGLALMLGRQGRRVAVCERWRTPHAGQYCNPIR
jgi:alkyl hydroperoxide reductase subunit AhpF